jgi:hypothetical protein
MENQIGGGAKKLVVNFHFWWPTPLYTGFLIVFKSWWS